MFSPRLLWIGLAFILLALGATFFLSSGQDRPQARAELQTALENLGFLEPIVREGRLRKDGIPYEFRDIVLDPDTFGQIKEIRVTPPRLFTRTERPFQKLEIEGLKLTGAVVEGKLSLSGLKPDNLLESPEGLRTLLNLADIIVLNKARIDLYSEDIGGFGFDFTGELQREGEDMMALRGDIRSVQNQFAAEGKVDGSISSVDGQWELALSLEQGKADMSGVFVSRLYGEASLTGAGWAVQTLQGQLTAGSATFHGFSFQAPSFTFEKGEGPFKLLAEAKQGGKKDAAEENIMDFGFLYSGEKPGRIQTTIFAPDTNQLLTFLTLPDAKLSGTSVTGAKNISLSFETPIEAAEEEEIRIPFIVKTEDEGSEKSGFAILKTKKTEKAAEKINIFWNE